MTPERVYCNLVLALSEVWEMGNILLSSASGFGGGSRALEGMFALRHSVFVERLGWDVKSTDGLERDEFDDVDPTYMIFQDDGGEVNGCWRLLPTTGSYMLRDAFPQLLRGEALPEAENIWELSRFAVNSNSEVKGEQAAVSPLTLEMIHRVYDFAIENDIDYYVTVTSVAVERMLKKINLHVTRFGDGKAQRVGSVLSVACWIDVKRDIGACLLKAGLIAEEWSVIS